MNGGIFLRSRAFGSQGSTTSSSAKRSGKKGNKYPRVTKRRKTLKLHNITETVKDHFRKLNTSEFLMGPDSSIADDKSASRYEQLLQVHEQHLKKLDALNEKYNELEKQNVRSLNAAKDRENDLELLLRCEKKKNEDFDVLNRRQMIDFEEKLKKSMSNLEQQKKACHRLSHDLEDEKNRRERVESELIEAEKQLQDYAKDPDCYDITDLGEMYADIFEVDAEEVNQYDKRRGQKTITGVACWFKILVMEVLSELNEKFLRLLEDDVDWFINFLFRHNLAHNFCLYLGQYNEYRKSQLKQMTRFNRNAFDKTIANERLKLLSLVAFALQHEVHK